MKQTNENKKEERMKNEEKKMVKMWRAANNSQKRKWSKEKWDEVSNAVKKETHEKRNNWTW